MMKLLIGTSNAGKIIEIKECFAGLPVEIVTPADLDITDSPHEHGDTFQANALEKARFYFERANMPALADDSGILVEALSRELGIHTRRWGAGSDATDQEWIEFFLKRMESETNRRATFICALAFIDEAGETHVFEGTCDGEITTTLEAGYLPGLPISACFKPDGYGVVYSAMSIEQKNSTSHRGKALEKVRQYLQSRG